MAKPKSRQTSFNFGARPARSRQRGAGGGRIDDSHQPFKRTRTIGPGPKKAPPVKQARDWECQRGPKKYTQICTYVGDNPAMRGRKVKSKMDPTKKRKYNKLYRAWAKENRQALRARGALPNYRCHKTRVTKCR